MSAQTNEPSLCHHSWKKDMERVAGITPVSYAAQYTAQVTGMYVDRAPPPTPHCSAPATGPETLFTTYTWHYL
ncbi:hypothetical protein J6590_081689 [Homalodisca vitripennis]|nr:hypothetical protein J6590_081689 [Homalodisca vitripennis]